MLPMSVTVLARSEDQSTSWISCGGGLSARTLGSGDEPAGMPALYDPTDCARCRARRLAPAAEDNRGDQPHKHCYAAQVDQNCVNWLARFAQKKHRCSKHMPLCDPTPCAAASAATPAGGRAQPALHAADGVACERAGVCAAAWVLPHSPMCTTVASRPSRGTRASSRPRGACGRLPRRCVRAGCHGGGVPEAGNGGVAGGWSRGDDVNAEPTNACIATGRVGSLHRTPV